MLKPAMAADRTGPAFGSASRMRGLRAHLLALIIVVLSPALAITGGAAWYLARDYRHSFELRLQDTARAMALFVDSELETSLSLVAAFASSPLLEQDDLSAFDGWVRSVGEAVGARIIVNEVGPGQRQLVNTSLSEGAPLPASAPPGTGASEVIARVAASGRPAVSDLFVGVASGRLTVVAAAPAFKNGRITRVVVLSIEAARLSQRLRDRRPSGTAFVSVADGQGRIVARSQDHERFYGTVPPSRSVPAAKRARSVFQGRTVYGEPALFSAQDLHQAPGWSVVVAEPYDRYLASRLTPLAALFAGAASALALGLFAAARLLRRILGPLQALVRRAEVVAAGKENVVLPPLPTASVAEFETLRLASDRADHALAAREAEFRAIFETAAAGVAEVDVLTGRYLRVNSCFCEITGRTEKQLVGHLGPGDLLHADDLASGSSSKDSMGGWAGPVSRLQRPDGALVWVQSSTAVSARDAAGGPLVAVTVAQDITERKRAEEAQALLSLEIDHRAKNALAVVQAALRLTKAPDVPSYVQAIEGRVGALARAQSMLAQDGWAGADLRHLLEGELAPFLNNKPGPLSRARLDGPSVSLPAGAAQPLAMAIHELATNAVKYGALSCQQGRLSVSWSLATSPAGVPLLRLEWVEKEGPAIAAPPTRQGFGSRVVHRAVQAQLGGTVSLTWADTGLLCSIEVPLKTKQDPFPGLPHR
jgi:PAS domain S-box-containing protein